MAAAGLQMVTTRRLLGTCRWIPRFTVIYHQHSVPRRTLFGISGILKVIANPAQTAKQLNETAQMLRQAREIPAMHTFNKMPGYFERKVEEETIRKLLAGVPSFTLLFGGPSVGKTAIMRQVLSDDRYHVIHLDLRIGGFASATSLYSLLCAQFEEFFQRIALKMENHDNLKQDSLVFKHARLDLQKLRKENAANPPDVSTDDISAIMKHFQSALMHYWKTSSVDKNQLKKNGQKGESEESARSQDDPAHRLENSKLIPVFFIDEANQLLSLIPNIDFLKVFMDSLLVLTKQDRLCHVVHATSDPFYFQFLSSLNIGEHCRILTIGDCTKEQISQCWTTSLKPKTPKHIASRISFDRWYDFFGGKLAHWSDTLSEFINSNGSMSLTNTMHFQQAYNSLQIQLNNVNLLNTSPPSSRGSIWQSPVAANPQFTRQDILKVMETLVEHGSLEYFQLCNQLGMETVDAIIRTRLVALQWKLPVTPETPEDLDLHNTAVEPSNMMNKPRLVAITPVMRKAMQFMMQELTDDNGV